MARFGLSVAQILSPSKRGYVYTAITLAIWSGFLIVSRLGGKSPLNAFDMTALRLAGAALTLAPWWLPRLFKPQLRALPWQQAVVLAALAGIIYPLLAYTGLHYAPASHGAVLIAGMLPFFTALLAVVLLNERPSRTRTIGLVLILLGVVTLLVTSLHGQDLAVFWRGDVLLLSGSVLWSLFTVLIKRWRANAFEVTLVVTALAALSYLPLYVLYLPKNMALASWRQIALQLFFQGVLVVCVAMWTYVKAAELLGPVRVVIMMSAVPVLGALLGVPLLGETLSAGVAMGVAVTFIGSLIGAMARSNPAPVMSHDD